MLAHAEECVDTCLNISGCRCLRSEVWDGFLSNCILLVVQGKGYMGGVLKIYNWSSAGRSQSPTKKKKSRRGRNWTIKLWSVPLVQLHHLSQKYKPSWTRSVTWWVLGLEVMATASMVEWIIPRGATFSCLTVEGLFFSLMSWLSNELTNVGSLLFATNYWMSVLMHGWIWIFVTRLFGDLFPLFQSCPWD